MKKFGILFLLLVYAVMFLPAQTRRALVIGLGEQQDAAWDKIHGDNDVPYMVEMLKAARYKSENITTLVNKQATKRAIVDALEDLAEQSEQGDIVYVHFSGHGQQMMDVHNDEKDGLDECWIPYDAYRKPCDKDRGEKHLTDDEVNYYLNVIRDKVGDNGKILVVIDACHSGDATRGGDDEVVRGVKDVFKAVKSYILSYGKKNDMTHINPNAVENRERWITLSACKSDQVNTEMRKPLVGKLTYAIYLTVKEGAIADNEEFYKKIKKFVNANSFIRLQQPVMTGEIHKYRIADILQ